MFCNSLFEKWKSLSIRKFAPWNLRGSGSVGLPYFQGLHFLSNIALSKKLGGLLLISSHLWSSRPLSSQSSACRFWWLSRSIKESHFLLPLPSGTMTSSWALEVKIPAMVLPVIYIELCVTKVSIPSLNEQSRHKLYIRNQFSQKFKWKVSEQTD